MNSIQSSNGDSVLLTIIRRVADKCGCGPLELAPLATVIDPDLIKQYVALDGVPAEAELHFRYNGCDVSITGAGAVRVDDSETTR